MICRVIERDPDNFMALSMRAMGIVGLCAVDFRPMREQDGEQALAMARKARSISPNSDFANYAVSIVQLFYKHDYAAAMRSARKSLQLNTGWIDPLGQVGRIEIVTGKPQQGIEKCTRTFAANPQSGSAYLHADAIALGNFVCADYAKAIEWCRCVEEIQPDFCFSTLLLISSLSHNHENSEAASEARQFLCLHPDFSITEMWLWPFQNPADWERLKSGLRAAGLAD
jgi:tetratricopeptide (TPR) repeat protein